MLDLGDVVPTRVRVGPHLSKPRYVSIMDSVLDGSLLSFAGWTLWYQLTLWTQWSLWWPARIWLPLTLLVLVGCALRSIRRDQAWVGAGAALQPGPDAGTAPRRATPARATVHIAGAVALVVLVALREWLGITPIAILAIALITSGLAPFLRKGGSPTASSHPTEEDCSPISHLVAAVSSVALAVFASLLLKPDADDAFYVNRATWVAEHGVPTLKDTMFSAGKLPSAYIGGPPLPSIEALQGALAHALHLEAASFTYIAFVPLLAAGSGWATWRLVRVWAPRQPLVVYLGALLFMLASADSVVGNYAVGRVWQGKVAAFTIVIPLIWYYLSTLVVRPARWNQLMLLAAGIAFVGLTSTAALLTPVIASAALFAALLLRSRALAVGAFLVLAAPFVAGAVLAVWPTEVGSEDPVPFPVAPAFTIMLGTSTAMVALGLVGVVFAARLAPGRLTVLVACGSLASMAALLPGVFGLVNAFTGSGPITWRLLLGIPTWVLVGMLLATSGHKLRLDGATATPRLVNGVRVALPTALVLVVVLAGTPIWSHDAGAQLTSRPTWKVDQKILADVRLALQLRARHGPWLLPPAQMEVLSLTTTRVSPVVPRAYYLSALRVSRTELQDRLVLLALVRGRALPTVAVRRALRRLGVSVACVPAESHRAARTLSDAVADPLHDVGTMRCTPSEGTRLTEQRVAPLSGSCCPFDWIAP